METLISELTFVTSLEQSPEAITTTRAQILNNKDLVTVASCLESLLFYRLGKEWETQRGQGFTMMLEQVHFARFMGKKVSNFHCFDVYVWIQALM